MSNLFTSTCVIVLGMHRSGTSLVSGILDTLGVNMGSRFRAPDIHNPTGYYEDLDWRDLNKAILCWGGQYAWYNPPSPQIIKLAQGQFASEINSLIAAKSVSPLWGFKDPRTCLTIQAIYHHLSAYSNINVRVIFVRRNVSAVVASLMRRAEIRGYYEPPEHWHALYFTYNSYVIDFIETYKPRSIIITYEQLTNPAECKYTIRTIADFIGVKDQCLLTRACELVRFR